MDDLFGLKIFFYYIRNVYLEVNILIKKIVGMNIIVFIKVYFKYNVFKYYFFIVIKGDW